VDWLAKSTYTVGVTLKVVEKGFGEDSLDFGGGVGALEFAGAGEGGFGEGGGDDGGGGGVGDGFDFDHIGGMFY
jgi:hypothetical protein